MKKAVSGVIYADLTFVLFLMLSGLTSGIVSRVLYYLAFAVPVIGISLYLSKTRILNENGEECAFELSLMKIDKGSAALTILTAPILVFLMMTVSLLSTLLLSLFGTQSGTVDLSGGFFGVVILHALLPAFMEEMLFRYIPIKLIAPHSKRCAVICSALFFALCHTSLYRIPYALIAGLILSFVSVATHSILPAIILHFLNNLASVLVYRFCFDMEDILYTVLILFLLAIVCLALIVLFRRRLPLGTKEIFYDRRRVEFSAEAVLFCALTLCLAVFDLFYGG